MRKDQILSKSGRFGRLRAGFLAYKGIELHRQQTFGIAGKQRIEPLGDDQAQYAVAEKLQPLVGCGAGARMPQRLLQQRFIGEYMTETRLERGRFHATE